MRKLALHWQILIAIILAAFAGWLTGAEGQVFGITFVSLFDFIGTLFINALKMLIVPLIASSMISGMAGIGQGGGLGRLGSKTFGFYVITTMAAIMIGLFLVNAFQPGIDENAPVAEQLALEAGKTEVSENLKSGGGAGDIVQIFVRMIPTNIVDSASSNGAILSVIFFSLLFGYFMTKIDDEYAEPQYRFWQGLFQIMMKITELIMKFAPIGVFGLVAETVATTGFASAGPLLAFSLVVLGALLFHALVTLPLMLKFIAGVSPLAMYQAMAPALLTAFSTASSSATLPVTMDCVEKNAGVSNRTSSFVLPLGATVNMNGTALYECVAVIFLAQAYGASLGFDTQFIIVVTALLTSIGVAGIPSASLVAIVVILNTVGLPAEAVGVLFVFDRILDMARTAINVFGDSVCAVIVAKLEGEEGVFAEPKPAT
ncbi:MAG: dicarboxylate/amino acid:cation symporter [Gammaproteobacteria bacterium]|nr:dicarboxylate/amino acid:cation symporter [Gammaproteobacteria bacterium]